MALGAAAGEVVGTVLRQAMAPIVAGMAIGLAGSIAFGRVLAGLLYGVSPTDALVMAAVPAVLSLAAGWRAPSPRGGPLASIR